MIHKTRKWWLGQVSGDLKVINVNKDGAYLKSSKSKLKCKCKCGNTTITTPEKFSNKYVTTCGRCNWRPISWWKKQNFKVKVKYPKEKGLFLKSAKKVKVKCSCGTIFESQIRYLPTVKDCGKCKCNPGLIHNVYKILEGTSHNLKVKCLKCGDISIKSLASVENSTGDRCSKCNLKPAKWWLNTKFGRLTPIKAKACHKASDVKLLCKCDCGSKVKVKANYLHYGYKKSCGMCRFNYKKWWDTKIEIPKYSKLLTTKFLELYFRGHTVNLIKYNGYKKSLFKCNLCNTKFKTIFRDFYNLKRVDCGCLKHNSLISSHNSKIKSFLDTLSSKVKLEHKLKDSRLYVDVFSKTQKGYLAIELNGLYWHGDTTKEKELRKYKLVKKLNYDYLCFFEDEWIHKQDICKNIIAYKLGKVPFKGIRPQKCKIKYIKYKKASKFYDKYHIQGSVRAKYHIGVFYKKKLLCVMSIGNTSRQSKDTWELKRMCARFDYKVHGIWSYILSRPIFKKTFHGKLVTFSDNRLFNGNVYKQMGMTKDYEIPQDYYWCKGLKRIHKSKMRKTKEEKLTGMTEFELRTEQGFHRVWDLGKVKYSIEIS